MMSFIQTLGRRGGSPVPPTVPAGGDTDVHIIFGQSNAVGRAIAGEAPIDYQGVQPDCYIYNPSSGAFETLNTGVNTQSNAGNFGPVLNAARLLRDYQGKPVYFVVFGEGGTTLSVHDTANDWNASTQELLGTLKSRVAAAKGALEAQGKAPVFKSMAWWQGESDLTVTRYPSYEANETDMFADLEQVPALADTKRVVYEILSSTGAAENINSPKRNRAMQDQKTLTVIKTDGMEQADALHVNWRGQLQAGEALFEAIKNL